MYYQRSSSRILNYPSPPPGQKSDHLLRNEAQLQDVHPWVKDFFSEGDEVEIAFRFFVMCVFFLVGANAWVIPKPEKLNFDEFCH